MFFTLKVKILFCESRRDAARSGTDPLRHTPWASPTAQAAEKSLKARANTELHRLILALGTGASEGTEYRSLGCSQVLSGWGRDICVQIGRSEGCGGY